MHIGTAGAQVCYSRVSRAVSVLRVRQRRRERVPDAFRSRALDRAKRERRVRVQPLDLISYGCNYIVILPPNSCMPHGRQSLIPIAFLCHFPHDVRISNHSTTGQRPRTRHTCRFSRHRRLCGKAQGSSPRIAVQTTIQQERDFARHRLDSRTPISRSSIHHIRNPRTPERQIKVKVGCQSQFTV